MIYYLLGQKDPEFLKPSLTHISVVFTFSFGFGYTDNREMILRWVCSIDTISVYRFDTLTVSTDYDIFECFCKLSSIFKGVICVISDKSFCWIWMMALFVLLLLFTSGMPDTLFVLQPLTAHCNAVSGVLFRV